MTYMAKDERRAQIMNATIDLVSRENLAAATARRIAQETGCSLGQIHHHFASADALRAEAMCEVWLRIEHKICEALQGIKPRERILVILACLTPNLPDDLAKAFDRAGRLWKEAVDTRQAPAVRQAVADGLNQNLEIIISTLTEGVENGDFPKTMDIHAVALRLMAASQGFGVLVEIGAVKDTDEIRREFMENVMIREGI